jgi:hypothetical protein
MKQAHKTFIFWLIVAIASIAIEILSPSTKY